jgi:ABC-type sugar transport system ATPase subunit
VVNDLNLRYLYGAKAITNLSFSLEDSERLCVLSSHAGGKTSLFLALAGLLKPESGHIFLNDLDITTSSARERDFVAVYGDGGLTKMRTVARELAYPLKIRKMPLQERTKIVTKTASNYGLYPLLGDLCRQLHDEDVVRLAIARASLRISQLYLIDNIFSLAKGSDRVSLFDELRPTIDSFQSNVIFTTDSVDESFSIGTRTLILNYGIMEQIGTPHEILSRPASLFVDKLVNRHNHVSTINLNGVLSFRSCRYAECEDGELYETVSYKYDATRLFAIFHDGISLETTLPLKAQYKLKIIPESVNYFYSTTEKRIQL